MPAATPAGVGYRWLGRRAYGDALEVQRQARESVMAGEPSRVLGVEHEPVYTLGRNADEANFTASAASLAARGIEVVRIRRGGDVTFHGPGQLVAYPIIHLGQATRRVLWYVERLETLVIAVLAEFGIAGARDPRNRGVWIGAEKIAALGVRVTGHVTMHGVALNVCPDLSYYDGIVPCGIRGKGVASMQLLGVDVTTTEVKPVVVEKFKEVFGYDEVVPADPPGLPVLSDPSDASDKSDAVGLAAAGSNP